jgi:hypothetical protein
MVEKAKKESAKEIHVISWTLSITKRSYQTCKAIERKEE